MLGGAVLLLFVGLASSVWSPLDGARGVLLVVVPAALAAGGAACLWKSFGR